MTGQVALLSISGLRVEYPGPSGSVRVLDDVSIDVPAGSVVGLVGESGSGKSSIGLASMGLLSGHAQIVAGRMSFNGATFDMRDRSALAALRGRSISMIFQDPLSSLNPVFTIRAHLFEVLRRMSPHHNRSTRLALAQEALETVGLPEPDRALGQYPHQLSGGMRQRVVIAMAMLARAKLVIADEPTTALDAQVEQQVMAELLALKDRIGCSIILISHSLGLVSRICDEIYVLLGGRVVEHGRADAVLQAPREAYTRSLLACEIDLTTPRAAKSSEFRFPSIERISASGS